MFVISSELQWLLPGSATLNIKSEQYRVQRKLYNDED